MILLSPLNKDLTRYKPPLVITTGLQTIVSTGATSKILTELAGQRLPGYSKGYKNPDWKNKVKQKQDATTPLELRVDSIEYHNIHSTWDYRFYRPSLGYKEERKLTAIPNFEYLSPGDVFPAGIDPSWSAVQEARNIALAYQRKYVADNIQPFQSQIFLGEIKETLDFIRHPFGKMMALANSAKVARYNSALKHYRQAAVRHRGGVFSRTNEARLLLGDVADAWYEVRFALLPLVQDIEAAFSAVSGRQVRKRSSFRGDGKQAIAEQRSSHVWPRNFGGERVVTGEIIAKYFINTGIIFDDKTNTTDFARYLNKTTLELSNFIPTVWELTPGSWLVDYFVNVGDILNSIAISSQVTINYDCRTTVVDYIRRYSWEIRNDLIDKSEITISSEGTDAYAELTRRYVSRVIGSNNTPSVTFSLPGSHGNKFVSLANTAFYLSRKLTNVFGR